MFYEKYVYLCNQKNLSPSTAAVQAGFNKGTVSVWKKKYEAGQDVVPEQDIINKICLFFGCSEAWLRGIENEPTQEGERISELNPAFFRLKQGLEPYDISESDVDFLLKVYKAHIEKNKQE